MSIEEQEQDGAGEEGPGPAHAALYSRFGFYSRGAAEGF